ncbi:uncharacterized protein METZ01_LOCUS147041 [marine metagenome]|uniref:Uncharacterized protein n=1 Tax=marine metagenome TaxID=408172 RepID=A0A381ZZC6_9ZZZZ
MISSGSEQNIHYEDFLSFCFTSSAQKRGLLFLYLPVIDFTAIFT